MRSIDILRSEHRDLESTLTREHVRIEEAFFDRIAETISADDDARLAEQFERSEGTW